MKKLVLLALLSATPLWAAPAPTPAVPDNENVYVLMELLGSSLKLIKEETERVIKGLEKKHFGGAKEAIEQALAIDSQRRETQMKLDSLLSESKKYASKIGQLMKEGQRDAAEAAKSEVAKLKEQSNELQTKLKDLEDGLIRHLCTIPNIPNDDVPEGAGAEDNVVVKEGGVKPELG